MARSTVRSAALSLLAGSVLLAKVSVYAYVSVPMTSSFKPFRRAGEAVRRAMPSNRAVSCRLVVLID